MTRSPLTTALLGLTAALVLAEAISAVVIWQEAYADSQPMFAVGFGVLYALAFWLQRSGRVVAGASLAGALALFEVVTFPTWQRFNALDWTTQIISAGVALIGFVVAVAVVGARVAGRNRTTGSDSVSAGR
jgi:hypothetical protein